jgi:hypothetical protein
MTRNDGQKNVSAVVPRPINRKIKQTAFAKVSEICKLTSENRFFFDLKPLPENKILNQNYEQNAGKPCIFKFKITKSKD